jgi:hypothetical protein
MTNPIPNPQPLIPNRSTGPRTAAGKQRSLLNGTTHGLTSRSAVLATEDPAANPPTEQAGIDFDIVDAHGALATLGLHGQRLSRQFQKALDKLREIQAERTERQRRDLKDAAALLELHKHKGIPWEPTDHGFVFSKDQVEAFAERLVRLNESRHIEHVRFHMQPLARASASFAGRLVDPT